MLGFAPPPAPAPAPAPVEKPAAHHNTAPATHNSTAPATHNSTAPASAQPTTSHATAHAPVSSHVPAAATVPAAVSAPHSDSDYAEVQTEVLKAISDVINAELSIESKRKLVKILQQQITSFEEKIMNSSDEQLVALVKELGIDETPKAKGREGSIEILLKYGRVQ